MRLKCKKCLSNNLNKNWKRQGKQRYLCKFCWFVWELWKSKKYKNDNPEKFFEWYVRDDLKYRQMWLTLNISKKTLQKILDQAPFKKTIMILLNLKRLYY